MDKCDVVFEVCTELLILFGQASAWDGSLSVAERMRFS